MMNMKQETRRPNAETPAPRRLMAVGRKVKDGWLIRTNFSKYQTEQQIEQKSASPPNPETCPFLAPPATTSPSLLLIL